MSYVLIIGAKSDMAKAIASKYAENGFNLYLAARDSKQLEGFATDIQVRTGKKVKCVELDVLDYASHNTFYHSLEKKPDGVISAVGYLGDQVKGQSDFNEAKCIFDTNYTGLVSLLNIVADDFEQNKSGFIVGISSVAGDRGRKSNYLYGASKAALTAYLSGLRNRLYDAKVQVLTVKPGFVFTKMTEGMDLPAKLTATPVQVAEQVYTAQQKGKDVLYIKGIWKYIMLIIRAIPESVFKRMSI